MRERIRSSLSAKVFLWVFAALTVCSVFLYGILLTVLPKQYQITSDRQIEQNTEVLVSDLQEYSYEDGIRKIYDFCIQNNSTAILMGDQETLSFGEIRSKELTTGTTSMGASVTFSDRGTEYMLVVSSVTRTADWISWLMVRFLPAVFGIIFLLSALSAWLCSKVIAAPVAELSEISRQMTLSDSGRKCEVRSSDEIGMLASSLNAMADRQRAAMEKLEMADRQRASFFAAASHELKTPLTILKGQLENMILGCGDYRNHEKYLPEAFKTAEDIELLVKEILSISKMEHMDLQNSLQEISLRASLKETAEAILPIAWEKQIRIHQNMEEDVRLSVNKNLWNKALSNIIGNAVRHSPAGGQVFISLKKAGEGTVLVVENTGVSIAEEELVRLSEPFYRRDPSRSRSTGGSGLGLYIVKTILDLHGMDFCMENTERGVAVSVNLKPGR